MSNLQKIRKATPEPRLRHHQPRASPSRRKPKQGCGARAFRARAVSQHLLRPRAPAVPRAAPAKSLRGSHHFRGGSARHAEESDEWITKVSKGAALIRISSRAMLRRQLSASFASNPT